MITKKIKASLTQGNDMDLTLRLWLTEQQRKQFVLEKGKTPVSFNIVIMDGGDEYSIKNIKERQKEQEKQGLKMKKRVENLDKDIEEFKSD